MNFDITVQDIDFDEGFIKSPDLYLDREDILITPFTKPHLGEYVTIFEYI